MSALTIKEYESILSAEMVPALGCTEPIAIALCTAKARELLGQEPETIELELSGNVIKNAYSVFVPNSGGRKGLLYAAALGICGGNAAAELEVLEGINDEDRQCADKLVESGKIKMSHKSGVACLYVKCRLTAGGEENDKNEEFKSATAAIARGHSQFIYLEQNGKVLLDQELISDDNELKLTELKLRLNFPDIWQMAASEEFSKSELLRDLIDRQIKCNWDIAEEGMKGEWGQEVGLSYIEGVDVDLQTKAIAYAAAGSDARMAGCAMPVVINSGSGNQGMCLAIPLIYIARESGKSEELLHRALFVANLSALYQKNVIGKLSAYCGAVSAAAASAAGLAFLEGCSYEVAEGALINALSVSSGLVCDGATGSCAGKILVSLENAYMGLKMAKRGKVYPPGEGLGGSSLEECIRNVGRLAHPGMVETDAEILQILLDSEV